MCVAETVHRLAEAIGGKEWGVNIGKPRVYLISRLQHAKVYIAFPKAVGDNLGLPVLRIQHQRPGRPYPSHKRIRAAEYKVVLLAAREWMQKNSA